MSGSSIILVAMRHKIHWLYRLRKKIFLVLKFLGIPMFKVARMEGSLQCLLVLLAKSNWIPARPLCCCCFETQRRTAAAAAECSLLLLTLQAAAAAAAEWRNKLEPAAARLGKRP